MRVARTQHTNTHSHNNLGVKSKKRVHKMRELES